MHRPVRLSMSDERRRFTRIPFDAQTLLQQDDWQSQVQLIDISLHGLLVMAPDDWSASIQDAPYISVIELNDGSQIRMEAALAHAEEGMLGFTCTHIDLDSISHLRRLIALNTGDEQLLERELKALI
tara:strand:- start:456 stop:836 length:381 start_codon:yes stop_codon:yes gene_type:complete